MKGSFPSIPDDLQLILIPLKPLYNVNYKSNSCICAPFTDKLVSKGGTCKTCLVPMDFASAKGFMFTAKVLFTAWMCFIRAVITNINNEQVWSDENPHAIQCEPPSRKTDFHQPVGWNSGDCLTGPYILPV
jgi:hypothetical protein